LAFTRNPSDSSVSPATYTADGASDLFLLDQRRNIAIDGSDKGDVINVSASALSSSALYNYDVRGFAGNDRIDFRAALIQDSTINGNIGNDTLFVGFGTALAGASGATSLNNSLFLGGKDNDTVTAYAVSNGEINGNIGNDTITVDNAGFTSGFNLYVGGGQGNDVMSIEGGFTNSIIDGNKGIDTISLLGGTHSDSSVNGGEGDDIIRNADIVVGGARSNGIKGLLINGDLGNDTIAVLGGGGSTINGGEGKDTIAVDAILGQSSTIDAGVGADTIALFNTAALFSKGKETIIFNSGDSVAASASKLGSTPGDAIDGTITFKNGVDVIAGFVSGTDKIDIDFTPPTAFVDGLDKNEITNIGTAETKAIIEVRGKFADGVFTTGAAATDVDYLYMVGGPNVPLGASFTNSSNIFISTAAIGAAAGTTGELDINDFV